MIFRLRHSLCPWSYCFSATNHKLRYEILFYSKFKSLLKNCILSHWTFLYKMNFLKKCLFCPKNAFFWQKWHLDPRCSALERRCQGSFFSGGILLLISWRILLGKVGHMVKPPAEHFQFSWKWAIFGRFENKSFWKWLELKTYCVCYPNTLLYMVLDHLWAKNCHNFGPKL